MALAVGPHGRLLAAGTNEGGPIHLWRFDKLRPRLGELGLDWDPPIEAALPRAVPEALAIAVDLGDLDPGRRLEFELEKAEEALEKNPDDVDTRLRAARASQELGLWGTALPEYEKILEKSFTYLVANELAWWYVVAPEKYRNLDRGLELVTRSLELEPDYWAALNTLGVVQLRREAWREAQEALQRSIDRSPGGKYVPFDYYPLAIVLYRLGEEAMSRGAFDVARQSAALQEKLKPDERAEIRTLHIEAATALEDKRPIPASLEE
jgi:tetratricopeptide (TPR) repeat protein